jgi:hypothetical protein
VFEKMCYINKNAINLIDELKIVLVENKLEVILLTIENSLYDIIELNNKPIFKKIDKIKIKELMKITDFYEIYYLFDDIIYSKCKRQISYLK